MPEPQIFICFRRGDSNTAAWGLRDRLTVAFGESSVLLDRFDFHDAYDWLVQTPPTVEMARAVVVLTKTQWLSLTQQRWGDAQDPVRQELELARAAPTTFVVPILIDSTPVPSDADQA